MGEGLRFLISSQGVYPDEDRWHWFVYWAFHDGIASEDIAFNRDEEDAAEWYYPSQWVAECALRAFVAYAQRTEDLMGDEWDGAFDAVPPGQLELGL